jgi:hypothetical protein
MSDLRERLLLRLQATLATIAPGVTFTYPFGYGAVPRPCETALAGRVYSRMRSAVRPDLTELPMVELVTLLNTPDTIVPLDDQLFERTVFVQLWGYVPGDDAADNLDSSTRAAMDALLADLQVAVEAFPYWTDTGANTDPLTATHGAVTITPRLQYTEPAVEQPIGVLVLDYAIAYKFHRLNP